MNPRRDVEVAYCRGEYVSGVFMESLLKLMREWGDFDWQGSQPGALLAAGRNAVVRQFLEHGKSWLFMVDSDHRFEPADVERLIDAADPNTRPLVCGLAYGWESEKRKATPVMYRLANPRRPEFGFVKIASWPEGAIIDGAVAGSACMLAHRSVFEKVAALGDRVYPWFREDEIGGEAVGEDLIFMWRALKAGVKTAVHTGTEFLHHKTLLVGHADYERR